MSTEPTAPITPLPIPAGVTRLMLFGGSFDPPHRAHVELAARARDEVLGNDAWLVFVPAARSPHKESGPSASDADRVAMLRLATRGVANSAVWTDEIDRAAASGHGVASYTVDTVRRARESRPGLADVRLLIGSDQAVAFHRWREPRRIIEVATPIVMLRAPHRTVRSFVGDLSLVGYWTGEELKAWEGRVAALQMLDVASTQLREQLAADMDSDGVAADPAHGAGAALDPMVHRYIREHSLYHS